MFDRILLFSVVMAMTGCSVVSFFAASDICRRDNIHCESEDGVYSKTAEKAAAKGFEVDKKIYNSAVSILVAEEDQSGPIDKNPPCDEGEVKVCSSNEGCKCESK